MIRQSGLIDLRVFPAGTGMMILAVSEAGEEIGCATVETGPPSRFQGGHGYFIEPGVLDKEVCIAVVDDLDVRSAWGGKGVGRAILERAEEIARQQGCEATYVHASNVGRGDPAGFYRACGFAKASLDGAYLCKTTAGVNRTAGECERSLGLLNWALLRSVGSWVRQCFAWIGEMAEMNGSALKTILEAEPGRHR